MKFFNGILYFNKMVKNHLFISILYNYLKKMFPNKHLLIIEILIYFFPRTRIIIYLLRK